MARWTVEVIPAAERELKALSDDLQARFLHVAGMLEALGPVQVGMPHVRSLGGKLWEMRLAGRDTIGRAIYFAASGRRLVVVRLFVKKTQRSPRREIALAERRLREQ
ncbi:MAG: type II toxin-antitoxin system RelE/ParE family toxin [Geminicoccales bacterium]